MSYNYFHSLTQAQDDRGSRTARAGGCVPSQNGMQRMDATDVVGHVGRKGLRFALTDEHGVVPSASMRHYGADQGSSVSGSLSAFQRDMGLLGLPPRLGLALAGLARGDVISITQTR